MKLRVKTACGRDGSNPHCGATKSTSNSAMLRPMEHNDTARRDVAATNTTPAMKTRITFAGSKCAAMCQATTALRPITAAERAT